MITEEKIRVFNRYRRLLELVPYSRRFFLCGSVARGTARKESDIDFSVRAQKNRVWLNRILINLVLSAIGKRRTWRNRADRFCLNASLGGSYYSQTSSIIGVRTLAEFFLEITLLGPILELASRKILSTYIESRFRVYPPTSNAVLILEKSRIIYHPPKMWKSSGLNVIDRWSSWANNVSSRTFS